MKDPFERTKVVVRRLPPAITQVALMEHIDGRFAGRYKWTRFCPGKNNQKNQQCSRIYINFNRPEDVVEFAEFFDGHVFVNEKGTQFKAIVEYAPSQRVPKAWSKKDGREGTISKDPEYLEFLELISKPVENLPSAEIQLEKKEAERAGGIKEAPIVTPLMLFVRQKRAAKTVSQRSSANGKLSRRAGGILAAGSSSSSSKRGSDKRRVPTSMYVLRDSSKNTGRKEKATFILVSRQEQKQLSDISASMVANGVEALNDDTVPGATETASAVTGSSEAGKKRVVLLKGKEREASLGSSSSHQQVVTSSVSSSSGSTASKQIPRPEGSGRIIRSILSKEVHYSEQVHAQNMEKDKRPPRPPSIRAASKDRILSDGDRRSLDDKASGNDLHSTVSSEKQEKRTRNKDRHDRGIWAPLRRSDGSYASDGSLSSSSSIGAQFLSESINHMSSLQGFGSGKVGGDDSGTPKVRSGRVNSVTSHDMTVNDGDSREMKGDTVSLSRRGFSSAENGHRHGGRRGSSHGLKEVDGSGNLPEGKHSKRVIGYGSHEKQIWVQKTGSG